MPARFIVLTICLYAAPLHSQLLLLDHGLEDRAEAGHVKSKGPEFLADRFRVGAAGEIWVIDRLRTWGRAGNGKGPIGGQFEKIALFGGLEADLPKPGQFECDCHNLMALQTAALKKTADSAEGQGVGIARIAPSVWQLDFDHLNWSVPGGVNIQFGVAGMSLSGVADRSASQWSSYTVPTGTRHEIKVFDLKGRFVRLQAAASADSSRGFAVQVWGHVPVTVEVRPQGELWEVILRHASSFDPARADQASLRFGPNGAAPVEIHMDGADLVSAFRAADSGIRPGELNACLTGKRQDGVPFEGCDLLQKKP